MSTIALDHANHLETWFNERVNDINTISQLSTVRDYCSKYCALGSQRLPATDDQRQLASVVSVTRGRSPSYESVHILTPGGTVIASTNPASEDVQNFAQLDILDTAKESKEPVLSSVHQHRDGHWRMHLLAPIVDGGKQPVAYVMAVLDVSKTIDPLMTDRVGLGETGETYLIDRQGRIISKSIYLSREEAFSRSFSSYGIEQALRHQQGTDVYQNYAGHKVVGSYLWLPRFEWGLLAEIEKSEIMEPLGGIGARVFGAIAVVTFLSLLAALFVTRRVSRPITRMADAAREIAEGRLDQRIQYRAEDEIGALADSFNSMSQKLSSLIASLQEKEKSLQNAYDELMSAQEQMVRSERMAAIGELVASVVHEMRNPLSSIKLNLQIIGRTLQEEGALSEHFEIALNQAVQLEKMFSDLLNYSKPVSLEQSATNIQDLIEKSLMQLKEEFLIQETRVDKEFDRELPTILVDSDKVQQVLVNIFKNAMEATGKNGIVSVSAKLEDSNGNSFLSVAISDDGPGVPPQHIRTAFQPFFTTKKKGTGLGLAIVRKIMEAHGAKVDLWSANGRGTTVRLRFPVS
jgi:signal transduction histidine kinase